MNANLLLYIIFVVTGCCSQFIVRILQRSRDIIYVAVLTDWERMLLILESHVGIFMNTTWPVVDSQDIIGLKLIKCTRSTVTWS